MLSVFAVSAYAVPTQGTPILSSTFGTNLTSENLTCYNQSTVGATKNIYQWYVNSEPFIHINMPFEGGSNSTWTKEYGPVTDPVNKPVVSGATWSATGGHDGKGAYTFNATKKDFITVNPSYSFKSNITVSAWANFNSLTAISTGLVSNRPWLPDNSFILGDFWTTNHKMIFMVDYCIVIATTTTPASNWTHYAGTYDGSTLKLYINGVLDNSTACVGKNAINVFNPVIGRWFTSADYYYMNGTIDDVMIFDRSLSAEQIKALYQGKTNLIVSQETEVGDVWRAYVTPNDGISDGLNESSNDLTILEATTTTSTTIPTNCQQVTKLNVRCDSLTSQLACNGCSAVTKMVCIWNTETNVCEDYSYCDNCNYCPENSCPQGQQCDIARGVCAVAVGGGEGPEFGNTGALLVVLAVIAVALLLLRKKK
jgi:hypothetical protein